MVAAMQLPGLDGLDTFPKLLLHNAANWPGDVAMREKDLGIWQSYGWARGRVEGRASARGLKSLGGERGVVLWLLGRIPPYCVWG